MRTNTIYFSSGEPSVEVLRLSKDGIWANPDIPADDAAKFVLNAIGYNIKVLVQAAVSEEREACIKACEQVTADLKNYASAFEGVTAETKFVRNIGGIVGEPFIEAIRARGQA
jgi:hypothetical protein